MIVYSQMVLVCSYACVDCTYAASYDPGGRSCGKSRLRVWLKCEIDVVKDISFLVLHAKGASIHLNPVVSFEILGLVTC